ncbi:MAG: phenylacetic acid degradation protein PaaY [Rhodospirillales bacterium]|nr:phenylacetic acid degradation protein PaaY [Rhodospirillales bacterium]
MPVYEIDGIVPVVDPTSFIHPTASLIGDVIVGPNCYVGPGASLRGDFGRLVMVEGCNLQDNCIVHGFPNTDTVMETDAHIGHGAILHGCTVRRNALIGMNAVVMDGAVIGENAFVAAMAFVKAGFEVPAGQLAAGIPARILRDLTAQELEWKIQGTHEYQDLTRRCLASFRETQALIAPEPDRKRVSPSTTPPLYKVKGG